MYCLIASLPPTWNYTLKGLAALNTDGLTSIRSTIKSLEDKKLLDIVTVKGNQLNSQKKYNLLVPEQANSSNYTIITNAIFKDKSLSLKAKGLYCLIHSLPKEHWRFSITGLAKVCKDGKNAIAGAVKELEKKQYLNRIKVRNEQGQYIKSEYRITYNHKKSTSENTRDIKDKADITPFTANPLPSNPASNKPMTENRIQYINKLFTNKQSTTNQSFQTKNQIYNYQFIKDKIKLNIEYDILQDRFKEDLGLIDSMVDIITNVYVSQKNEYTITDNQYTKSIVIDNMEKLCFEHVEHILLTLKTHLQGNKIYNFKNYLLSCLFNANLQYELETYRLCSAL